MSRRFFMNPHTGSVDTEENWRADFASMPPEQWGADTFDGAYLIEVVRDEHGGWIEQ